MSRSYQYEHPDRFRFEGYDELPGFCSFLPGVAGRDGMPLWCMYVNRGQAVVSFGVADKEHAILEFLPATWAYQLVTVQGFRTFCKVNGRYYEPFQRDAASLSFNFERAMRVGPGDVSLQERNATLGLLFDVEYFSPPHQPVATLLRHVRIQNTSEAPVRLEVLDGLPLIIPAGFSDFALKKMRHIMEAYVVVRRLSNGAAFYAPKVQAHDEAEVLEVKEGNFYCAWQCKNDVLSPLQIAVDPHVIFGGAGDLVTPRGFISEERLDYTAEVWENRLPCALTPVSATVEPGQAVEWWAVAGYAPNSALAGLFLEQFHAPTDFVRQADASAGLLAELVRPSFMLSSQPILDAYARQNYLDNVLRGGVPLMLPSKNGSVPLHLYARRHGDLERDYNSFELAPNPLSDGAGNYRDVCQNRRYDVWFYPQILDSEIRMFLSLLQADGYNPLGITGFRWHLCDGDDPMKWCPSADPQAQAAFARIFQAPFAPGSLWAWADEFYVPLTDRNAWLEKILSQCESRVVASGFEGGYWIDHWTYITDLLEAYEGLWPDKVHSMLTEDANVTWFDEGVLVQPRSVKYVERPAGMLQLNAIKQALPTHPPLPPVTAFAKLCALLAVKAVSLDSAGQGMEMEAGRPGWNDSMNGLPALLGSSTCETAEAARLARWLKRVMPIMPEAEFPLEVADFMEAVMDDLSKSGYDWDGAARLREHYRDQLQRGISGSKRIVQGRFLESFIEAVEMRMIRGMEDATAAGGPMRHTYFMARPTHYEKPQDETGFCALSLERVPLPLFLEGQVHWLRLLENAPKRAAEVHEAVRRSGLMDHALQMYKICECLDEMPPQIGRARTFSRGWFENESIWLHMTYKYLLELLRCGLYREFYDDTKSMLVPFMNPAIYGRSLLENSSFIACSECPDARARGRGFIARLSGSTAEFIHIWLMLTVGKQPFYMERDSLRLALKPALPGEWFTTEPRTIEWKGASEIIQPNSFACSFLGDILLVYHNPSRNNTYGEDAVRPMRYQIDGQAWVEQEYLDAPQAGQVRERVVRRIDVALL